MSNIGYHTRLRSDNTRKIVGGSFGGSLDMDTTNRLVNSHFTVVVKNSGIPIFVDREGREVTLYISVDAAKSTKGAMAVKEWREERAKQQEEDRKRREREEDEVDTLMGHMTHDEIVRRLKSEPEEVAKKVRLFKVTDSSGIGMGVSFQDQVLEYLGDSHIPGQVVLKQPPFDAKGKPCVGVVTFDFENVMELK